MLLQGLYGMHTSTKGIHLDKKKKKEGKEEEKKAYSHTGPLCTPGETL